MIEPIVGRFRGRSDSTRKPHPKRASAARVEVVPPEKAASAMSLRPKRRSAALDVPQRERVEHRFRDSARIRDQFYFPGLQPGSAYRHAEVSSTVVATPSRSPTDHGAPAENPKR